MSWSRTGEPDAAPTADQGEYASALFEGFAEGLDRLPPDAGVLDLGPAISDNLMFWIRRGRPVAASDLRVRIEEGKTLELDGRRFGGVICWNALAYIPAAAAEQVLDQLVEALVPGGMLFAIFDGDGRRAPERLRYRILTEGRLRYEPMRSDVEPRAIPNSEIERLMGALRPTRTTVMRHGAREALGQIPRPPSDPFPQARSVGGAQP